VFGIGRQARGTPGMFLRRSAQEIRPRWRVGGQAAEHEYRPRYSLTTDSTSALLRAEADGGCVFWPAGPPGRHPAPLCCRSPVPKWLVWCRPLRPPSPVPRSPTPSCCCTARAWRPVGVRWRRRCARSGLRDERHFTSYHRVLNRAVWSPLRLSRLLLHPDRRHAAAAAGAGAAGAGQYAGPTHRAADHLERALPRCGALAAGARGHQ
jgi:hypothetical protein